MIEKRVIAVGFAGGVFLGVAALNATPIASAADDIKRGLLGQPSTPSAMPAQVPQRPPYDPRPDILREPSVQQPTIPTFEQFVQSVLPGQERMSLLQLQALARMYEATYGDGAPADAYIRRPTPIPRERPSADVQSPYSSPYAGLYSRYSTGRSMAGGMTYGGGRRSIDEAYGPGSASSSDVANVEPNNIPEVVPRPNVGAIEVGSGQYFAPAGPGAYVDPRDGTHYAPAGPNGVVNTRTGQFTPVHR